MERERKHQRTPRFTKRLEATFRAEPFSYRGILSDISENGLFIRTNHGFAPGTLVDIEIIMPDDQVSRLKGIVRRSIKTPLSSKKNGMGIELTKKDTAYINFFKSYVTEPGPDPIEEKNPVSEKASPLEFQITPCPGCGVKNKVLLEKISLGPKCSRCGTPLS